MPTDRAKAMDLIQQLFEALVPVLCDTDAVLRRVAEIEDHAKGFPEVRFCKGCVLPIVDLVATRLLRNWWRVSPQAVRRSLLCEGYTSLPKIYAPGPGQSGFGASSWAPKQLQPISKSGTAPTRGAGQTPDFGICLNAEDPAVLQMLGEVKYEPLRSSAGAASDKTMKELDYYLSLPRDLAKNWEYDFGFGIAYAAGGAGRRKASLITDHWVHKRFAVAVFEAWPTNDTVAIKESK